MLCYCRSTVCFTPHDTNVLWLVDEMNMIGVGDGSKDRVFTNVPFFIISRHFRLLNVIHEKFDYTHHLTRYAAQ